MHIPGSARALAVQGTRGRLTITIGAAVVSALLAWAASPPVGIGWLACVAFVPALAVALRLGGRCGRAAVPLAYALYLELLLVPAFPLGITKGQWGDPAIPILVADSPVLAIALVAVPVVAILLFALRFPFLAPLDRLPGGAAGIVAVVATSWAALDFLRVKVDPSVFWGPLFLATPDGPGGFLVQLGGPWLVTGALAALNTTVALLLVRGPGSAVRLGAAAGALIVLLVVPPLAGPAQGKSVRVAAVQPGYDTAQYELEVLRWFRPGIRDYEQTSLDLIDDLAPLTREAAADGAELVVWPEAVAWSDPRATPSVRAALARLADETNATIVVPYFLEPEARGATIAVLPDGSMTVPQPKLRPMGYLGERSLDDREVTPLTTPAGTIGVLLGVDAQGFWPAREHVAAGARILVSGTHDWEQLAPQQLAFARLQAQALAVPLVRADWRYGSAVIDAGGTLVAEAGPELRRTVVTADIQPRSTRTPYVVVGDAFGWAALGAAGLLTALLCGWRAVRFSRELGTPGRVRRRRALPGDASSRETREESRRGSVGEPWVPPR
jgi:apolipoprotein N-acyltransferase